MSSKNRTPRLPPLSATATRILAESSLANAAHVVERWLNKFLDGDTAVLDALSEAVCGCSDSALREALGLALLRSVDVLRMGLTPERRSAFRETAHYLVAVPFVCHGDIDIVDPTVAIKELNGEIDEAIDGAVLRDPNGARLPGLVLTVPGGSRQFGDQLTLNMMIGNPDRHEADGEYFRWWHTAMSSTLLAHQNGRQPGPFSRQAFLYVFSQAVPGNRPLDVHTDAGLPLTDFGHSVLDVIMRCADGFNRRWPAARLELLSARRFSEALGLATTHSIKQFLGSVSAEPLRTMDGGATFSSAGVRSATSSIELVRRPAPGQFVDVGAYAGSGGLIGFARFNVPLGMSSQLIEGAVSAGAEAAGLTSTHLGPVLLDTIPKDALGGALHRSEDGEWRTAASLQAGPNAYRIVKQGEWSFGWDARLYGDERSSFLAALANEPDPVAMERAGLTSAYSAHYQAPFLESFRSVMRRPGCSREVALVALQEEFEYPIDRLLLDGQAARVCPTEHMYAAEHFRLAKGAIFVVRERLQAALDATDLSDDFPMACIRAPFPDCYFHLERPMEVRQEWRAIVGDVGGDPIKIVGFYVLEEFAESETERALFVLPVCSFATHQLDLTSIGFRLDTSKGSESTLATSVAAFRLEDLSAEEKAARQGVSHLLREFHRNLVKILLYTTLPDRRERKVADRSHAITAAAQLTGRSREKAMARASALYDFISIGPESATDDDVFGSTPRTPNFQAKSWVRRGSYGWQAHGPKHSLLRYQWRRPTIAHRQIDPGDDNPDKKRYQVG